MKYFKLPYGTAHLDCSIPDDRFGGIITSSIDTLDVPVGIEAVRSALANPSGSPRLSELARGKNNIVLIASDHTRPVPSRDIIPPMLDEIYSGNPDAHVTILIATGFHRPTTESELEAKFGREIMDKVDIVLHDSRDDSMLVKTGTLPSGGELIINKLAYQADLLISEGFIEPHFFAGFSGGRKSVLPGIASRKTVFANHCAEFIADENARTGILENNPIHRDMLFAAKHTGLKFIVNVVINSHRRTVAAFAGDCEAAHIAGTEFLSRYAASKPIRSDIVITTNNGAPLDQNVYQAVKGMSCAEATVNSGGVIIMAAKCADGIGGDAFYRIFKDDSDAASILR